MAEGHEWIRESLTELGRLPFSLFLVDNLYSSRIITEEQREGITCQITLREKNSMLWRTLEKKCMVSPDSFDKIMDCLKSSECPDALRILDNCRSSKKQATSAASSNPDTKVASKQPAPTPPTKPTKPAGKEEETWQAKFLRENKTITNVDDKTLWSKCLEISNKSFDYKNQNTNMSVKCGAGKIVLKNVKEFKLNSLFQNISTVAVEKPHTLEYVTEEVNNAMFQNFLSYSSMLTTLNIEFPIPISIPLSKLANLKFLRVTNANLTAHTPQDICSKMETLLVFNCKLKGNNLETGFPKLFPQLKSLQIENQKCNKRAEIMDTSFLNGAVFKKLL